MAEVTKVRSVGHTFRTRWVGNTGPVKMHGIMACREEDPELIQVGENGDELYRFRDNREVVVSVNEFEVVWRKEWACSDREIVRCKCFTPDDDEFEAVRAGITGDIAVSQMSRMDGKLNGPGMYQVRPEGWQPDTAGIDGFWDKFWATILVDPTRRAIMVAVIRIKGGVPKRVRTADLFWWFAVGEEMKPVKISK